MTIDKKMTITIVPFTIYPNYNFTAPPFGEERHTKKDHLPITYWGIYLNDKQVSFVSSKELAEKTKLWIEKWLEDRL